MAGDRAAGKGQPGVVDPGPRRGDRRRRCADRPGKKSDSEPVWPWNLKAVMSAPRRAHARQQAEQSGLAVRFFTLDVLREPIPPGFDVVTCSLFLHHLDEADASGFLRKAADATGRLLLVNDLVRGPVGYLLAWWGCRFLSRSPIVRHDGPVSVAGAFTPGEVRKLAANAGLDGREPHQATGRADFSCLGAVDVGASRSVAARFRRSHALGWHRDRGGSGRGDGRPPVGSCRMPGLACREETLSSMEGLWRLL